MDQQEEVIINLPARLDQVELPDIVKLFAIDGPEMFVAHMREVAAAHIVQFDPTTDSGRAGLVTAARDLAHLKVKADNAGKEYAEEAKKVVDDVNRGRRKIREDMDALQKEIRRPVTEYEEAEEKRIADHEAALTSLGSLIVFDGPPDAAELRKRLETFESRQPREWEEYLDRALPQISHVGTTLRDWLARQEKYEAEQTELAELRAIKAERDAKTAEDKRRADAAEAKRKWDAEVVATVAAARIAAEAKAEQDAKDAKAAADEAIKQAKAAVVEAEAAAAEQAERRRIANEKALADQKAQAEEATRKAEIAAEQRQQKAIADERARVERERVAKEADDKRRAADLEHRQTINRQAVAALKSELAYVDSDAQELIMAIVRGKIPHVSVNY